MGEIDIWLSGSLNLSLAMYGQPVYGAYPAGVPYGGYVAGYTPPMVVTTPGVAMAGNSAAALALDAADGVIDGRINGAPIVNAGGPTYGGAAYGGAVYGRPTVYAPPAVIPTTHTTMY